MDIGIGISEDLPLATQVELARDVEEAGFGSLWTNEAQGRDALLVCQSWGTATSTLRPAVGVLPIWTRSPAQIGMAVATLQDATDGRFTLGLGVSHPATMDTWHGAEYRRPLTAAREMIEILRTILAGGRTDHDGRVFSSRGFQLQMDPPPEPARIHLAAMGPRMLELAGKLADGVLLNWSTPDEIGRAAAAVRGAATRAERGRIQTQVDIAAYVRVAVDEDQQAARRALASEISRYCALPAYAEHFARQGFGEAVATVKSAYREGGADAARDAVPEAMLRRLGWYGTPDDAPTSTFARYAAAGLKNLIARVVVVDDDTVGSIRTAVDALSDLPVVAS